MSGDSLAAGKGSQKTLDGDCNVDDGNENPSTRAGTRQTQRHQWLLVPTALRYISQKYRQFLLLYRTVKEYLCHNLLISCQTIMSPLRTLTYENIQKHRHSTS